MNDLSPAARELVESHRRSKGLPRADRARMKQKLMLRVATLGATTVPTGTAMGMSLFSKLALVALGVTAVSGAGVFTYRAVQGRVPAVVRSPGQVSVPRAPEAVAPAPVMPEAVSTPAGSIPIDNGRRDPPKKRINRPSTAVAPVNRGEVATPLAVFDPEPELRLLREAREDLRAGRSERAYRRLDEYGRLHRGGMLAQERRALSAIAYCQWRPGPEAQTRAAEFLRNAPESPLASRVSAACGSAGEPSR